VPFGPINGASPTSDFVKVRRKYLQDNDKPIMRDQLATGDWVALGVLGLIVVGGVAVAAHFVGVFPALVGAMVILGVPLWLVA
jgi:hypothetical protein